jgi:hypothetical protein
MIVIVIEIAKNYAYQINTYVCLFLHRVKLGERETKQLKVPLTI